MQYPAMQFGFCYIPDYHESRHGDYQSWYQRLLHEWQTADSLGYDAIWIAEHRFPGYGFCSTPVVAQAIASSTKRIRVGTAVTLLPQRHPVLTAEDWAAVDLLSGGRLNFGIGRGIFAYDFATIGVPSSESRARFEESWDVIRRLWTEDHVTHQGKFWSFADHSLRPKPLQQPMPPAFVGCIATPESYQWAGANGMNLIVAPFLLKSTQQQREFLDLYRDSLVAAGHDPADFQIVANYHLALVPDEEQTGGADRYISRYLEFLADTESKQPYLDKRQYAAYASGDALAKDVEQTRKHRAVVGTPQQCIDRIGELAEACGMTSWMFHINYGGVPHERVVEQMHLFAEEVMPAFATSRELVASAAGKVCSMPVIGRGTAQTRFEASPGNDSTNDHDGGRIAPVVERTRISASKALAQGARLMTSRAMGYLRCCVLFAANKLEIFTAIGDRAISAADIARQLQLDPRGTEKLLNACTALGLLEKDGEVFRLSEESRLFLDRASSIYLGDWMAHWADMLIKGNWQQLDQSVRTGRPVEPANESFSFDKSRDPLNNWVVGMHEMGVAGHADLIASAVSLESAASLLDVGGGPGTYSMYLCRRFPGLQATIVDSPEVGKVAKKLIRQAKLAERIQLVNFDFCTESLGRQFDIVLLSNVLHMCQKAGALAMLRNAANHLAPGGRLVVQEWILNDDASGPELPSLFDLHMLLNPNGDVYRLGELKEMIGECGFSDLETIETGGLYDVIVAKKMGQK